MSFGKSATLTASFVATFGLGVWAAPYLTNRTSTDAVAASDVAPTATETPAAITTDHPSKPRAVRATNGTAVPLPVADRTTAFSPLDTSIAVSTPELHMRLKSLLKAGADMEIASEGFNSAEQFATVVHASQNTDVPFMLLKHRVLNEGDTLVAAIRKSKPGVDAVVEADRARAEARSDIASLD